jgi:preprotein translocase subunit SecY
MQAITTVGTFRRDRAMVGPVLSSGALVSALAVLTMLAGFVLLWALSEVISRRGIGSGPSVIIVVTMLSSLGSVLRKSLPRLTVSSVVVTLAVLLVIVALVVVGLRGFLELDLRSSRLRFTASGDLEAGQGMRLRVSALQGGVLTLILASSFATILVSGVHVFVPGLDLGKHSIGYALLFAILLATLARLQLRLTLDPVEVANGFSRGAYYIPGVAPGWPTANRLSIMSDVLALSIALLFVPMSFAILLANDVTDGLISLTPLPTILLLASFILDIMREVKHNSRPAPTSPKIDTQSPQLDPWLSARP